MAETNRQAKDPYTDGSGGWPIPVLDSGLTFKDQGSSGLRQYGGWVREEFLPQLQGRLAARAYREMLDNSSVVGGVIFAITQAMRKVEWRTVAASDKPGAKEAAEFADSLRHDMSHTWNDFVVEALSMLGYGFAPHEIVYKKRQGRKPPAGEATSNFNDGKIGLRRLPIRGQDTILKWFFGVNGEILGLTQQPWIGQLIDIPIEKMLLFRPSSHKNNPEGRSVLRNAYRPYYFLKRLEEQEAILFERLSGLPVMYVPNSLLEAAQAGETNASAALAAYKKLITNVRIDEQMGVILPSDVYMDADGKPTNVRLYDFTLMTPQSGRSNIDADKSIARYKLDIMMTLLADFIMMGHEVRGTNNLAVTKVDLFYGALAGWLDAIADVCNRYLLPRVWRINGFDPETLPQYVPDMAQRMDLDSLGTFLANLASAGMPMFPDEDLENFLRDAAGLPDLNDEAVYSVMKSGGADGLKRMLLAKMARAAKQNRGA